VACGSPMGVYFASLPRPVVLYIRTAAAARFREIPRAEKPSFGFPLPVGDSDG
jgi:hypothetical protein